MEPRVLQNCWEERILLRKLTRIVEGRRVIAKEVDDKRTKEEAAAQQQKKAAAAEQAQRSTGPVDRTCTACTGSESGRPPGRPHCLTVIAQVSVGHPVDRAVDRWMGSVDRQVDRKA